MKKLKTNTGITLVALIITIIVLLILAVVSIRAITGGEGIFTKTENATQRYEEERINEVNTINGYQNAIDQYYPKGNASSQDDTKYYCLKKFENGELIGTMIIAIDDKEENKKDLTYYSYSEADGKGSIIPIGGETQFYSRTYTEETTINGIVIPANTTVLVDRAPDESLTDAHMINGNYLYLLDDEPMIFELTAFNDTIKNIIESASSAE